MVDDKYVHICMFYFYKHEWIYCVCVCVCVLGACVQYVCFFFSKPQYVYINILIYWVSFVKHPLDIHINTDPVFRPSLNT